MIDCWNSERPVGQSDGTLLAPDGIDSAAADKKKGRGRQGGPRLSAGAAVVYTLLISSSGHRLVKQLQEKERERGDSGDSGETEKRELSINTTALQ